MKLNILNKIIYFNDNNQFFYKFIEGKLKAGASFSNPNYTPACSNRELYYRLLNNIVFFKKEV